jgi:hypothetical protein
MWPTRDEALAVLRRAIRPHLSDRAVRLACQWAADRTIVRYPFLYALLRRDDITRQRVLETITGSSALGELLDIRHVERFIKHVEDGRLFSRTFSTDAELYGSLVTVAYSFRNMLQR